MDDNDKETLDILGQFLIEHFYDRTLLAYDQLLKEEWEGLSAKVGALTVEQQQLMRECLINALVSGLHDFLLYLSVSADFHEIRGDHLIQMLVDGTDLLLLSDMGPHYELFTDEGWIFRYSKEKSILRLKEHFFPTWVFVEPIRTVVWAPDGKTIASGGDEGVIRLWQPESGLLKTSYPLKGMIQALAYSPDGTRLVACGKTEEHALSIWDLVAQRQVRRYTGHTRATTAVAWSLDGTKIASASGDTTVQLWEAASGQTALIYRGHTTEVGSVAWSPDGQFLISGDEKGQIHLWDAQEGKLIRMYEGHMQAIHSVAWSADGGALLSASQDGTVRVWNVQSGACLICYRGHADPVWAAAWSPDGTMIASGGNDGTVRVWEAFTGRDLGDVEKHGTNERAQSLAWSPDGAYIVVGLHIVLEDISDIQSDDAEFLQLVREMTNEMAGRIRLLEVQRVRKEGK